MGNALGFGPPIPSNATVTHESYCQRLGQSVCGVCVGVILFFVALGVLAWNEFNCVHNEQILAHVAATVVEVGCDQLDANSDGKPVWASCQTKTLYDFSHDSRLGEVPQLFGRMPQDQSQEMTTAWISAESEIYQWVEDKDCHKEKDGHGGTTETCTYTYQTQWTGKAVNSNDFGCIQNHIDCKTFGGKLVDPRNIGSIPKVLDQTICAPDDAVSMGIYGLNSDLLSQLQSKKALKPGSMDSVHVPDIIHDWSWATPTTGGAAIKFTQQPLLVQHADSIGDVQTTFAKSAIQQGVTQISAVALQRDIPNGTPAASLKPWDTGKSGTMRVINWAAEGAVSLDEFISRKYSENSAMTMLLRLAGWLLTFLGLQLITGPISLAPQVVPCIGEWIGEVVGCALCCINFTVSLSVSLTVIGLAWLIARPLLGAGVLVVALLLVLGAAWARGTLKKPRREPLLNANGPPVGAPVMAASAPAAPWASAAAPRQQDWARAAAPGHQEVAITVPSGVRPGDALQVTAPDGSQHMVTVPAGMAPGQTWTTRLPVAFGGAALSAA